MESSLVSTWMGVHQGTLGVIPERDHNSDALHTEDPTFSYQNLQVGLNPQTVADDDTQLGGPTFLLSIKPFPMLLTENRRKACAHGLSLTHNPLKTAVALC